MLLSASPTSATSAALASLCHRLPPQKPFVSSNPKPNPNPNCSLIRSSSLPLHKPQTPPKKPPPLHSLSASDALETIADEVEDEEEEKQVEAPATWAVTGNNNEDDLVTTLISAGVIAFLYFFVAPPIIMNWMRLRWYKRKFLEMFLQFMCVFVFFPGLMLWAPFLNFRKFPRDPTMKYPWSTPKDDVPLYKSR